MHKLFESFAGWYDMHTPPDHYFRDHELVLSLAAHFGQGARLLDVGCGTGVLVEKAQAAGLNAAGFDASENMIKVARRRLPKSSVWTQRMQDLVDRGCYDIVVSMSWCVHYCRNATELRATIRKMNESLRVGGRLLLQVAHGPNLPTNWAEDREVGPTGLADDVRLRFKFQSDAARTDILFAEYEFHCASTSESFNEIHELNVANANVIAEFTRDAGFDNVEIWNSWRRDAFADSGNVFVTGVRRAG